MEDPTTFDQAPGALRRSFGRTAGGDLVAKAALLATTVIAAQRLGPDAFGTYAGLLAVAIIASAAWDAGMSTLVVRAAAHEAPGLAVGAKVLRARIALSPIWLAVALGGVALIAARPGDASWSAASALIASLATASSLPLLAWLRGRLRFGRAALAVALGRWVTLCATAGVAATSGTGEVLPWLIGAYGLGEIATLGTAAIFLRERSQRLHPTWEVDSVSLRRALPYAANNLLSIAYNRLDVVLVAVLTTGAQLAAYAPASRLQDALYLVPTSLGIVALPYLSRAFRKPPADEHVRIVLGRVWLTGLAISIPVAVGLIATMPLVVDLLLGSSYAPSVLPARILSLSMILASIGAPILALLIAADRGPATTKAFAVAFGVSVALHCALDWWLGALGAALASLARDAANVAAAAWLARDLLRGLNIPTLARSAATDSHP